MEKNMKENIYMYNWVTLYTADIKHDIVNQGQQKEF